jgi:hypothetical protein
MENVDRIDDSSVWRKNRIFTKMNQEEYIKFLEERLKHSDEQLTKAMEMLAILMSKMPV